MKIQSEPGTKYSGVPKGGGGTCPGRHFRGAVNRPDVKTDRPTLLHIPVRNHKSGSFSTF